METLIEDLRFGARLLIKQPGFTSVAVLTLALGLGANTAIFSLVNAVLLRPLPVTAPDRLVSLNNAAENRNLPTFSYPNYRDLRDRNDVFSALAAYRFMPLSVRRDGSSQRLWGYVVTGNYFEVLGVPAALGRTIAAENDRDTGADPVAVISHKYWQQRFGGDPQAIGRDILVNGRAFTVIGVAPAGFHGSEIAFATDFWFPMSMAGHIGRNSQWLEDRGVENIFVIGRLRDGVSTSQAESALNLLAQGLEREYPAVNEGKRIKLSPPGLFADFMRGQVLGFAGVLMGVVVLVLILACTNLANLLLSRAMERRREIAIRLAVGAGRRRIVRQLLTESVLLALSGGALGLLLAAWLLSFVAAFKPPVGLPVTLDLTMDYRVLGFCTAVSLLSAVFFGLLPAWQATRTDLVAGLKNHGSAAGEGRKWLRNGLVVSQVALSLLLLACAGLVLRGLQRAQRIDPGFEAGRAAEMSFDLEMQGYDEAQGREFQQRLLERVRSLPGVQAAGLTNFIPLSLVMSSIEIHIEGRPPGRGAGVPLVMNCWAGPGYFEAVGTPLVAGREFFEQDNERAPRVAVVNATFARRFWPGEDALGKRFSMGSANSPMHQVVGVAADGKYFSLNEEPRPFVFGPMLQDYYGGTILVARTSRNPSDLLAAMRAEVAQLDPHLPVYDVRTLAEHMNVPLFPARVAAGWLGSFGVLALTLATTGLFGVMSCAVSQRTREIGIRMALGAGGSQVRKLIVGRGMGLAAIGAALGLVAGLVVTRWIAGLLYGVSAVDPWTFGSVTLLLLLSAWVACWLPARRAARVDPMRTLRS